MIEPPNEPLPMGLNQCLLIQLPFGALEVVPLVEYVQSLEAGHLRYSHSMIQEAGAQSYLTRLKQQIEQNSEPIENYRDY